MLQDSLGNRQKAYESAVGPYLIRRMPVVIRVDGQAFHTLTRNRLPRQDDPIGRFHMNEKFHRVMTSVAHEMVQRIQGAQFAYTQSDEISIFVRDWDTYQTEPWFGNNRTKIETSSAALATALFNFYWGTIVGPIEVSAHLATFDARAFNVPNNDLDNYFIWRQKDAIRNSINFIARLFFSQKELHGKNTEEVLEMLVTERNVHWRNYPIWEQRGVCVYVHKEGDRSITVTDVSPPLFQIHRTYITKHLEIELQDDDLRI